MKSFRRSRVHAFVFVPVLGALGCSGTEFGNAHREKTADELADEAALAAVAPVTTKDLCGPVQPGFMRCHAKVVTDAAGERIVKSKEELGLAAPSGLGPPDIQGAYKLPTSGGGGRTIAIVDAMDAKNAETDLATYRTQFGLSACTTANGCFKKVNQNGQASPLPAADSGWAGEIMLDLDMASAVCPDCKILLVEANSASTPDLGAAVNTAATMGASAISNSYGGPEDSTVTSASSQYYKHAGILVTVSSGDSGYGVEFPASSEFVMAVGGTNLAKSSSTRGWAESAWSMAGSGCSAYITKPTWEKDTGCTKRMESDISAVADPATGVAVYDDSGWAVVGGTSASSPIVASIFTLFNLGTADASWAYSNTAKLFDITSGSNGSCTTSYECKAGTGYDGPTGNGTPNGALISGSTPPDGGTGGTGGGTTDAGMDTGRIDAAGAGGTTGTGGTAGSGGTGGTGGSAGTGGGTVDAAGGSAGSGVVDAGRGGTAGTGGSGGAAGSGGSTGGSGGTGGSTGGTGGTGGSTGGTGGGTGGSGGSAGSAGGKAGSGGSTGGRGGSAGTGGTPPSDPGCGCMIAAPTSHGASSAGGLLLLAAAIVTRRRRR